MTTVAGAGAPSGSRDTWTSEACPAAYSSTVERFFSERKGGQHCLTWEIL